jgi:hypothetical protein
MDSFIASAASVAGRSEVPRQLLEPMPRRLELIEEVIERERRLQRELAGQLVAHVESGLRSAGAGRGDPAPTGRGPAGCRARG